MEVSGLQAWPDVWPELQAVDGLPVTEEVVGAPYELEGEAGAPYELDEVDGAPYELESREPGEDAGACGAP